MTQGALFTEELEEKPVNVATVPLRSPFRYPGGKTWLVPTIRRWLRSRPRPITDLIEPFAGGAIVGLTCACEDLVLGRVTLVERDPDISAVWQTIIHGQGYLLAEAIARFQLTAETVREAIQHADRSTYDRAVATLIRNRVSRGGILAPGAGFVKNGENGKGLQSRWYPQTLKKRILDIVQRRNRLCFIEGDGLQEMWKRRASATTAFFIDPPYVVAGRRLYTFSDIDHGQLFETASVLRGDFLMTYDNTEEIHELAQKYGFDVRRIVMKNTHHEHKFELLIGRDLRWVDSA